MVHAGLEKTFPVEANPKTNRAQPRRRRKFLRREIDPGFVRHQVHVRKNHDPGNGLLGNLGAPPGFSARIITLAFLEPEFFEEIDQIDEMFARAAKSVMIMIAPAETEQVLPSFLDVRRAVAVFPIAALGFEKELAGKIATD